MISKNDYNNIDYNISFNYENYTFEGTYCIRNSVFNNVSGVLKNSNNFPIGNYYYSDEYSEISNLSSKEDLTEFIEKLNNYIKNIDMINITNKQVTYSVTKESDNYSFTGELKLNSENGIDYLNGVINSVSDESILGNLYYSINSNNKLSKNINNVPVSDETAICEFIDSVISDVKDGISELEK